MQRRNVDLPEPDGPSRHITSPGLDLEVIPFSTSWRAEALVHALGADHRLALTGAPLPQRPHAAMRRRRCSGVVRAARALAPRP